VDLTGNTILISGGTSGVGHALAEAFYQRQIIIATASRLIWARTASAR
jgi:uncharacterized oxidoreductase